MCYIALYYKKRARVLYINEMQTDIIDVINVQPTSSSTGMKGSAANAIKRNAAKVSEM